MSSSLFLTRRQFTLTSLATASLTSIGLSSCKPKLKAPFRVGVLLPKSGLESQVGQSCIRGSKIAPFILKDMGMDAELIYADTESSADVGRTKAEQLINEGAHILVGAYDSGVTLAIAQVCEQKKIPLIVNISAAPQITEQGYQYVFRNFLTSEMLIRNGLNLMNELFTLTGCTPKTAAFFHVNDTYGQAMRSGLDALMPKLGMPFKIVETISYDPKTRDLSTEIAKVKASGAELLIPVTRLNDAILMIRECVKQRYQPKGIISTGSPGMYESSFYKTLGKYSDNCITNSAWYNPHSRITQRAMEIFAEMFPGEMFELNVSFTCEAILIAADAYKRAGSSDSESLQRALRQTNMEERIVCGGPIQFDEKGQGLNLQSVSLQNKDGRPTIVLPTAIQQAKPILPMVWWKDN